MSAWTLLIQNNNTASADSKVALNARIVLHEAFILDENELGWYAEKPWGDKWWDQHGNKRSKIPLGSTTYNRPRGRGTASWPLWLLWNSLLPWLDEVRHYAISSTHLDCSACLIISIKCHVNRKTVLRVWMALTRHLSIKTKSMVASEQVYWNHVAKCKMATNSYQIQLVLLDGNGLCQCPCQEYSYQLLLQSIEDL